MTPDQMRLVQSSFEKVVPLGPELTARLYDRLFEIDPRLRAMFGHDLSDQRARVLVALATVVRGLDAPGRIVPMLRDLGRRHFGYGVRAQDYDTVGAALLSALGEVLGEDPDSEVVVAWTAAFGVVASTMLEGAAAGEQARIAS